MSQQSENEPELPARLASALRARSQLAQRCDAYRLLDAEAGVLPGVSVEIYGKHAVIVVYRDVAMEQVPALCEALLALGFAGVYCKPHLGLEDNELRARYDVPVGGVPASDPLQVHEDEQYAQVSLCDGLSTGLFLDQRDNRALLRKQAGGARVLNLFCYTGSFTVAAALGGAVSTVSVDTSARALRRTSDNLALNGCVPQQHRLLKDDASKWLARAQRRGDQFDFVVLDPPSFSRQGKKTFSVERDYAELARASLSLLAPAGKLLAVLNHKASSDEDLQAVLRSAATTAARDVVRLTALSPPEDCCDSQGRSSVKSVLVEVQA